jgi:hypothetical protein
VSLVTVPDELTGSHSVAVLPRLFPQVEPPFGGKAHARPWEAPQPVGAARKVLPGNGSMGLAPIMATAFREFYTAVVERARSTTLE